MLQFGIKYKILRLSSIVFLFLVQMRFQSNSSTIQVLRNRYCNDTAKLVRQFERFHYKYYKLFLDLSFLGNCIKKNVTPTFMKFWLASRDLRDSSAYLQCQQELLKQEIVNQKRRIILVKKFFFFYHQSKMNLCLN